MSSRPRYWPGRDLPRYVFVPGENPHPKKEGGHMFGEGDPVSPMVDPDAPTEHEFLGFGLDLFNHGYYWESHVYFEAVWNAHERQGAVADLMKAFIKLGAAGIKLRLGQVSSAVGHIQRARELIEVVYQETGDEFLGFNLGELQEDCRRMAEDECIGEIHPRWPLST